MIKYATPSWLSITTFLISNALLGQTFTKVIPTNELEGVRLGAIAFADVNSDGFEDVLVTGQNNSDQLIAKLYLNDGSGIFHEKMDTPFEGVWGSAAVFADVNGDSHPDLLLAGTTMESSNLTTLYLNDGTGNFTERPNTPFEQVGFGTSIACADVDGDGDEDVLINGDNEQIQSVAKLYLNDGAGNFTERLNTPFTGTRGGTATFADTNGDSFSDILISGRTADLETLITTLYVNDGAGNFTEKTGLPFTGVTEGAVAFADVNGDGSNDLILTGETASSSRVTKLYLNDGNGDYTERTDTPFAGVGRSTIAIADINGDGYPDCLLTGWADVGPDVAKLYTNDGTGHFTEMTDTPFTGVQQGSVALIDLNNDGTKDAVITGKGPFNKRIAKLYINSGAGTFTEKTGPSLKGVVLGSAAFADINNDGYEDVLIAGANSTRQVIATELYTNDGQGRFTRVAGTPFEGVFYGSVAMADVNGDGYKDVLVTGRNISDAPVAKLYINDGNAHFSERTDTPFTDVYLSSVAFADVNGDNHVDLLLTGFSAAGRLTSLYLNDGTGQFTEQVETPFDDVANGSVAFADLNGDSYPDVLLMGFSAAGRLTSLYLNDGTGQFSEQTNPPFDNIANGSIAFADVNDDGHIDVLLTGEVSSSEQIARLYTNDGSANFTEVLDTPFAGVIHGSIAFADVNNDSYPDVLITGAQNSFVGDRIARLYTNDGTGNFSEVMDTPFKGVAYGVIAFSDINSDGYQDVFITGESLLPRETTVQLYANDGVVSSIKHSGRAIEFPLKLFPNPCTLPTLQVEYEAVSTGHLQLEVYSMTGVLLQEQSEFVVPGKQAFQIGLATFPKGAYLLKLQHGQHAESRIFIIQ